MDNSPVNKHFKSNAQAFKEFEQISANYFSQCGEDALLEYVLSKIPDRDYWCVEFGAWDGIHLSNTYYFISTKNYKSVLIECDAERYLQLCSNLKRFNAICINRMVGFEGKDRLDKILSETPIPANFDLLSIDIDGDDYLVWEALTKYSPKVVIIEINQRFKPDIDRINTYGSKFVQGVSGTSIKSMTELAKKKGYCLLLNAGCNAIYVQEIYFHLYYQKPVSPESVFTYQAHSFDELSLREIRRYLFWAGQQSFLKYLLQKCIPSSMRPIAKRVYGMLTTRTNN